MGHWERPGAGTGRGHRIRRHRTVRHGHLGPHELLARVLEILRGCVFFVFFFRLPIHGLGGFKSGTGIRVSVFVGISRSSQARRGSTDSGITKQSVAQKVEDEKEVGVFFRLKF